jgi:hypothetical protein
VDDLGGRVIADHAYRYHARLSPYKHHHSAGAHDRTTCTAAQAAGTTAPSFKSPAIAEDIAGYSCLRLVKLRAIFHYIPLYLYLTSAIAILEVIRYVPLAGDLKPCTATPLVAQPSFAYAPHFYRGAGGYPLRSTIRQQRDCFYYHPVAAKTHTMVHPRLHEQSQRCLPLPRPSLAPPIVTPPHRCPGLLDSKMASFPHSPRSCSDEPVAPQDDHADMSSDNSNIAADRDVQVKSGVLFQTLK